MVRFDVSVTGLDKLSGSLSFLNRGLSDFSPLWEKIEGDFYQMERDLWASQGNGKWAPNSGLYAERKAEHFPGRVVMELHGDLYKSMTVKGAAGQVRRFSRWAMTLGTNIPYAAVHHYGSGARMWIPAPFSMWINGVPERPLLDVAGKDVDRWNSLGESFVADVVREAGL